MSQVRHAPYMFSVIRRRLQEDHRVVDFAIGSFRYPLPAAIEALLHAEAAGSCTSLRGSVELDEFRERAAAMLDREYGVTVEPRHILPAPSGRSAMSGLVACLMNPGDGVLVTEPGYPAFARLAVQMHGRLVPTLLDPDRGFAPDLDAVPGGELSTLRLAAINYPNNPTGAVLTEAMLETLDERLPETATIFNDLTYGLLTHESTPRCILSIDSPRPVLELHTFSKLFALGPQAIAFFAGTPALVEAIENYADFAWPQLSSLQVRLALCCLDAREHVEDLRRGMAARVTRLREVLTAIGLDPYPTPAGPYVLCPSPTTVRGTAVSSARHAAEVMLDEHQVAVAPWEAGQRGYLRFSSSYRDEDLERLTAFGPMGQG